MLFRCGRGGASASGTSGGPLSGLTKPGEAGMSNQTSVTGGQSSSAQGTSGASSSGATGSSSSGGEGTGPQSALNAAAASSAFGRGLAMLAGDSDGDEGEMGRLQALLEARGLPPHRKLAPHTTIDTTVRK